MAYLNTYGKPLVWQTIYVTSFILVVMPTEEELTKTTFRLPKSLLRETQHYAIEHDKTDTDIFNEALREYLGKRAGKK